MVLVRAPGCSLRKGQAHVQLRCNRQGVSHAETQTQHAYKLMRMRFLWAQVDVRPDWCSVLCPEEAEAAAH